jgi:hypothetical protein
MNTYADVSKFKISPFFNFKCCILLKPVLGGVDGNLHLPVPSMNRHNQTEPATFLILSCWAFFRDSVFLYFKRQVLKSLYFLSPAMFTQLCFYDNSAERMAIMTSYAEHKQSNHYPQGQGHTQRSNIKTSIFHVRSITH